MTPILFCQTAELLLLFLLFQSETVGRTANFRKEKQHEGLMFFVLRDPFEVLFDLCFWFFSVSCHLFLHNSFVLPFFRRVISCSL